ncbi:hypothetical protein JRO89_XS01G0172700 [Xanthoceras sorbifolium]|uniref:AMP-dependent synthetase/ligase domain-containing protein n=1 Tax=Xanthoceras sorbifolium TaxID=99658 RepID=A0ABQ8IJS8_9ROSI|nr:hypothetical protein JRO89_XS01G0172700 [Xanthoceras sorbifolium]
MSQASHKLPLNLRTISIDSPEFSSLLTCKSNTISCTNLDSVSEEAVNQSDVAAIIYSSGTTSGRNKGILLTHRNLIGRLAGYFATDVFEQRATRKVSLVKRASFGSFGLITMTRGGRLHLGRLVLLEKASELEAGAKIVDPQTGATLSPGHTGELLLRGPTIMEGYIGDEKATAEAWD